MADNIIDFNELKNKASMPGDALSPLPDIPAFNQAQQIASDRILRSVIIMQLTVVAMAAVESAGLDQSKFHMNLDSVERFYDSELDEVKEDSFNGVWFDWMDGKTLYRVATTVVVDVDSETANSGADIFRISPDDEEWESYENGEWKDYGPPADHFEWLLWEEEYWDDEDDDEDGFYVGDGWDDDEEIDPEDEDSLWDVGISPRSITALEKAGIRTVADLVKLSVSEALKIKGIGEKSLAQIMLMLEHEGFELKQ